MLNDEQKDVIETTLRRHRFSPRAIDEVTVTDTGTEVVTIHLGGNRHIQLVKFDEEDRFKDDQTTVRMDGIFRWRSENDGDVFTLPVEEETFDPDHVDLLERKLGRLLGSRQSGDPMQASRTGLKRSQEKMIEEVKQQNRELGEYSQRGATDDSEPLEHTANQEGTSMADILNEIDEKSEGTEEVESVVDEEM